ncbi:hypothetical protein IJV57_00825 [Candidatus Saccharibacteria bacterium]|nr:hypothetical protein [Candidatus Saccharibacteria bacterium]
MSNHVAMFQQRDIRGLARISHGIQERLLGVPLSIKVAIPLNAMALFLHV